MKKILLTGATGFVGQAVHERLAHTTDYAIVIAGRRMPQDAQVPFEQFHHAELTEKTDWSAALQGVDAVVHMAARAHVMRDDALDPLAQYRAVNVAGTLALARQAAHLGVRRFVFISSIKVNGEETRPGFPYTADDQPAPADAYGISKMQAEQGLKRMMREAGMEVVIIRPVLVYGPKVKANFRRMMAWLKKGVPLPLGAIHNQRSLVALDNLVDLITTCVTHPAAANEIFLVSDGEDLSTTELLQRMATALGVSSRLFSLPPSLLRAGAALVGKRDVAQRLCGSLQVDIAKTRALLGWKPEVSVETALKNTADDFLRDWQS